MRFHGPYYTSIFSRILVLILLGGFFLVSTPSVSQDKKKTRLERINEKKNKQNRRSKRRGDRGFSNERQLRAVRAKARFNQGDRPYKGDITGRKLKSKVSPRRPSFANWASPDPYAGRKRKSEASRAKAAKRYSIRYTPVSITRSGERPYRRSISGKPLRTRNTSSYRPGVYSRTNPYLGRKRITETTISRRALRLRTTPRTVSNVSRRSNVRRRVSTPRTVSSQGRTVTPPVDTYTGKRQRSEEDASRDAVRLRRRPTSDTRRGERSTNRTVQGNIAVPRTISGSGRRVTRPTNVYSGKKQPSEGERFSRYTRRFSAPNSISGTQNRPPKNKRRITPRTVSSGFKVNRRRSPYGAGRKIREWERGYATDITGRKFRSKPPSVLPPPRRPPFNPYEGRKRIGDKPYSGRFQSGYQSATPDRRRKTYTRNRYSAGSLSVTDKFKKPGRFTGRGAMSITRRSEDVGRRNKYDGGRSLSITSKFKKPGRMTGRGSVSITRSAEDVGRRNKYAGGRNFSVTDKYKKPGKMIGRGSMSITRNAEDVGRRNKYAGGRNFSVTDKYKKPGKMIGRGSMSITRNAEDVGRRNKYASGRNFSITDKYKHPGKMIGRGSMSITRNAEDVGRRNKYASGRNFSITDKYKHPGKMIGRGSLSITKSAEEGARRNKYTGGRQLSVTGKFVGRTHKADPVKSTDTSWNNKGKPLAPRMPSKVSMGASTFVGNMKAEKPLEGGGSKSRNNWNNKGKPLSPRLPGKNTLSATSFAGNMKAVKPIKGAGGSISGSGWNNNGDPIDVQDVSPQIFDAARFTGRFKRSYYEMEKDRKQATYSGSFKKNSMTPKVNDEYRNYSGSIKVTRQTAKDYHPSFYMHRDNRDDSMDHKSRKFSLKLIWAKVFHSNNPAKARKDPPELQFDEREQGLWFR